ncbi:MAG: hypothetical protein JWO03_2680 [Bacteroidetes bacterium]|nr:hypothetical protein [Bacteroidota bacterium]
MWQQEMALVINISHLINEIHSIASNMDKGAMTKVSLVR